MARAVCRAGEGIGQSIKHSERGRSRAERQSLCGEWEGGVGRGEANDLEGA